MMYPPRRPSPMAPRAGARTATQAFDQPLGADMMFGLSGHAVSGAQRAGHRVGEFLTQWVRGLTRAPVRFHLTADDHAILPTLAAQAPAGIRARCVRARVRLGGQRSKLVRMYVEVSGRADFLSVRRWLRDGLRDYEGEVRIDGVPLDCRVRRLRDA